MLAQAPPGREWRYAFLAVIALALAGCGGGKIGELIKDSPSQEGPAQTPPNQ